MNKTDEEIVKILEYCEGDDGISYCNKCPLYEMDNCVHFMSRKAREIINRLKAKEKEQQAEIEILNHNLKCEKIHKESVIERYKNIKENLKAVLDERADYSEAIKEFAERLKDRICENVNRSLDNPNGNNYYPIDVYKDIDNLVKEMTESEGKE